MGGVGGTRYLEIFEAKKGLTGRPTWAGSLSPGCGYPYSILYCLAEALVVIVCFSVRCLSVSLRVCVYLCVQVDRSVDACGCQRTISGVIPWILYFFLKLGLSLVWTSPSRLASEAQGSAWGYKCCPG